jgi:uncharacterized membrane protein YeaQ/YmgE (transglycosylase-associated protein family)
MVSGERRIDMHIVAAVVIGGIVGSLARFFLPGKSPGGVVLAVLLGVTGGLGAGFLGRMFGWYGPGLTAPGIIASILGAMLLLFGHRMMTGWRRTT